VPRVHYRSTYPPTRPPDTGADHEFIVADIRPMAAGRQEKRLKHVSIK